jgi:chromosome segregation ATPase
MLNNGVYPMDGTTATTLAPSEEDMNRVTEVFAKMRDAVISASQLAQEVGELRNAVGSLRNELESLRSTNRWMDGQITDLRAQRDSLQERHTLATQEIARLASDKEDLQRHCDNQRATLAGLNEQVAALRRANGELESTALEAWAARDELQKKLDAVIGLVCPKPGAVTVEVVEDKTVKLPEQPRDPETQQFKSWEPNPTHSWEE